MAFGRVPPIGPTPQHHTAPVGGRRGEASRVRTEVPEYAVQDQVGVEPAKTALLVIDMQNDFVKQEAAWLCRRRRRRSPP